MTFDQGHQTPEKCFPFGRHTSQQHTLVSSFMLQTFTYYGSCNICQDFALYSSLHTCQTVSVALLSIFLVLCSVYNYCFLYNQILVFSFLNFLSNGLNLTCRTMNFILFTCVLYILIAILSFVMSLFFCYPSRDCGCK